MKTKNSKPDLPFGDVQFLRKPSGAFLLDGVEVAHTIQCCHGGEHFVSVRGSGNKRGWCMNCNAMTCGAPACDPCLPFEKRLDLFEKGLIKNV